MHYHPVMVYLSHGKRNDTKEATTMKRAIMKRAWEIKRQHKDNDFGICLSIAWEEYKALHRRYIVEYKANNTDWQLVAKYNDESMACKESHYGAKVFFDRAYRVRVA